MWKAAMYLEHQRCSIAPTEVSALLIQHPAGTKMLPNPAGTTSEVWALLNRPLHLRWYNSRTRKHNLYSTVERSDVFGTPTMLAQHQLFRKMSRIASWCPKLCRSQTRKMECSFLLLLAQSIGRSLRNHQYKSSFQIFFWSCWDKGASQSNHFLRTYWWRRSSSWE